MANIKYHPNAERFLSTVDKGDWEFRFLTDPLTIIASKECLFWTIEMSMDKLRSYPQDALSRRTLKEIEGLKQDFSKEKAHIFDELSFKNWYNKSLFNDSHSVHLPLSRICWASLGSLCRENNYVLKSNYRDGNNILELNTELLDKQIGWSCSLALSTMFDRDYQMREKLAYSYSLLMRRLEG